MHEIYSFIDLAMFMSLVSINFQYQRVKMHRTWLFFMKITFLVLSLYWRSPGKSLFL